MDGHGGAPILRALLALALVAALFQPVVTEEQVEAARREVRQLELEADLITRRIEDVWARQFALESRIALLEDESDTTRAQIRSSLAEVEDLAIRLYMEAAAGQTLAVAMAPG